MDGNQVLSESILSEVTVGKMLASLGCYLVVWADILRSTDPNESYTPFMDTSDEMVVYAEVLLHVIGALSTGQKNKSIVLPPHIGAVSVPNPLYKGEAANAVNSLRHLDASWGGINDDTPLTPA